ncbi:MAG: hypothetical protein JKX85_02895 [Phycisphaeraceae bacterium]|nr:hypothetical protein [Phycisphaeraceae bacterium]
MSNWTTQDQPRIWRSPKSDFCGDEIMDSLQVYSEEVLRDIASHGFNAIWLRGRLADLMDSTVLPELNRPGAAVRVENLQKLIERGKRCGVNVFLYFNEPLALQENDPFWETHKRLQGQSWVHPLYKITLSALCTSDEQVQAFFNEAVTQLMGNLLGLGGVVLITASEYHSHCWSHYHLFEPIPDGISDPNLPPMTCKRCADREPADVVNELLTVWSKAADTVTPRPKVLAWNWSWAMWYEDPQAIIIENLPAGVELMLDFERGGVWEQPGRSVSVDEYSMGYTGPSERFNKSNKIATEQGIPVHAKMQIGTTHELATVPNMPLIPNLHRKMAGLTEENVQGIMACWNFGCSLTLNSYAIGLFTEQPTQSMNPTWFMKELAQSYFGTVDTTGTIDAWTGFSEAFSHYPFSMKFLYFCPLNYAPAYPLSLSYKDVPLGGSWIEHTLGDRVESCLDFFDLDTVTNDLKTMATLWQRSIPAYEKALTDASPITEAQSLHRFEELSCAKMIGLQLHSSWNVFRFYRWRKQVMEAAGLNAPCTVTLDVQGAAIIKDELANVKLCLELTNADTRLGYHQEPQFSFYDSPLLEAKCKQLEALLA